jgi:CubicO group peptidase (beta-lactamase class C family)
MKFHFLKRLTYILVLFLISSCTKKDNPNNELQSLDEYFSKALPANEPGAAILIMRNDSVIFSKGYGLADVITQEPITTKTLFNIGSISKTFVSNAILKLQNDGKLSVNDSLYKYFPTFKNKMIAQSVKIKHLLTHTSGLPDNRQVSRDTTFYLTAKDNENWYPVTQTDTLMFEPGSQFEYSNPSFNGLALIAEKVSGMPWQKYVEENIMKPSGMILSTITNGAHPEKGVSHGYVKNNNQWTEDDYGEEPTFPAAGNGGVWSSVEELCKYEQALQSAKFLTKEIIDDSRTVKRFNNWRGDKSPDIGWSFFTAKPNRSSGKNISPFIGWSWFIGESNEGLKIIGHTGSQGGFLANYVVIPDKKIFFVILCNTPRGINEFTNTVINKLEDEGLLK